MPKPHTGVGNKKHGVTHKNVQNLINSEGPMIIGPDVMLCGTSIAKTNPASMRDKIKMDNPGKKLLTPRGGQIISTSAHTAGASHNSSKI